MSQKCQDEALERLAVCFTDGSLQVQQGCCSKDCAGNITAVRAATWWDACNTCCIVCMGALARPARAPGHSGLATRCAHASATYRCCCCVLSQSIKGGCFPTYVEAICTSEDPQTESVRLGL